MVLSLENMSLPTHILQALRGDLSAVNTVTATEPQKPVKTALHSDIAQINAISAIDDIYYEIETHELNGDNSHVSLE